MINNEVTGREIKLIFLVIEKLFLHFIKKNDT